MTTDEEIITSVYTELALQLMNCECAIWEGLCRSCKNDIELLIVKKAREEGAREVWGIIEGMMNTIAICDELKKRDGTFIKPWTPEGVAVFNSILDSIEKLCTSNQLKRRELKVSNKCRKALREIWEVDNEPDIKEVSDDE